MQKSTNSIQSITKDKQYLLKIPEEIATAGKLIGAAYAEFGETQCLTIFNAKNLYFLEIANESVVRYSSYNMINIRSLVSIIKGYLLITTKQNKLWLFELKKIEKKSVGKKGEEKKLEQKQEEKILTVQSYLKQIPFLSYSLREVTPNMVELFISTEDEKNNRVMYIYQFTIKQKVGGMAFTVDKNYKIIKNSRKQLYASKNYYDPSIFSLFKLKNFSDAFFFVKKVGEEFLNIVPVCKTEQYYGINKNSELVNVENTGSRKSLSGELQGFSLMNSIVHLNYLLLQKNNGEVGLFMLDQSLKLKFLGKQSNQYSWQICFNGKLVGINKNNSTVRITKQLNKRYQRAGPDQLKDLKNVDEALPLTLSVNQIVQKRQQVKIENQPTKTKGEQTEKQKKIQLDEKQMEKSNEIKEKPNESQMVKNEELEFGKQKSSYKPTKIISRKDLKKDKVKSETRQQMQNSKDEANVEQKSSKVEEKVIQNQSSGSNNQLPNQPIEQKTQISHLNQSIDQQQKNNLMSARKKQNINLLKLSENFFNSQTNLKPMPGQSKIQTIINNQTDPKAHEKSDEKMLPQNPFIKKQDQEKKRLSPFSKKNEVGVAGASIIPKVSLDQIFGSKPINYIKPESPLFSKDKFKKKESPFKKKQQTLQIQNNSLDERKEEASINRISQSLQENLSIKIEEEKRQQIKEREGIEVEIKQNCCVNLQETRNSYQKFGQKIDNLEIKTIQMKDLLSNTSEAIIASLSEGYKKSLNEILESSCQKTQSLMGVNLCNSVNDYMSKKLTPKVNDYFKNVLGDTKKIYDTTHKFYSDKNKESMGSIRYHFQEQEHLLNQIKLSIADMLVCVENTVDEGEQSHAYLLKQWQKSVEGINHKLDSNLQSLENHAHDRSASERQKIIDTLAQLKQDLQNEKLKAKKQASIKIQKKIKVTKEQKQKKSQKMKVNQKKEKKEMLHKHNQGYYLPMPTQNTYFYH